MASKLNVLGEEGGEEKIKKERRVGRVSKHSLVYSIEALKSGVLTVNYTVVEYNSNTVHCVVLQYYNRCWSNYTSRDTYLIITSL